MCEKCNPTNINQGTGCVPHGFGEPSTTEPLLSGSGTGDNMPKNLKDAVLRKRTMYESMLEDLRSATQNCESQFYQLKEDLEPFCQSKPRNEGCDSERPCYPEAFEPIFEAIMRVNRISGMIATLRDDLEIV